MGYFTGVPGKVRPMGTVGIHGMWSQAGKRWASLYLQIYKCVQVICNVFLSIVNITADAGASASLTDGFHGNGNFFHLRIWIPLGGCCDFPVANCCYLLVGQAWSVVA